MKRPEFTNIFKELGKKNIAIMGHMGSGKSLTGKILAKQLGFQHLDSDLEIIKLTNKSINQIFEEKGEKYLCPQLNLILILLKTLFVTI